MTRASASGIPADQRSVTRILWPRYTVVPRLGRWERTRLCLPLLRRSGPRWRSFTLQLRRLSVRFTPRSVIPFKRGTCRHTTTRGTAMGVGPVRKGVVAAGAGFAGTTTVETTLRLSDASGSPIADVAVVALPTSRCRPPTGRRPP